MTDTNDGHPVSYKALRLLETRRLFMDDLAQKYKIYAPDPEDGSNNGEVSLPRLVIEVDPNWAAPYGLPRMIQFDEDAETVKRWYCEFAGLPADTSANDFIIHAITALDAAGVYATPDGMPETVSGQFFNPDPAAVAAGREEWRAKFATPLFNREHYWGACPQCYGCTGRLNIRSNHWFYCDTHKTKWLGAIGLFSDWKDEEPDTWQAHAARLENYTDVDPAPMVEEGQYR